MEKKNNQFFHWLQSLFKKTTNEQQSSDKKLSKYHYAIVILAVGVAFMLVSNILSDSSSSAPANELEVFNQEKSEDQPTFGQKSSDTEDVLREVENHFETQLKEILQSAVGVDEVEIMVNLDATESKVFEKNVTSQTQLTDETDREGGKRKVEDTSKDEQLVIIRNGDTETPVVINIKKPAVRGVLIVANGADNIQVKKNIIEAVTRVLDVPSHRVSVLPKKKPKGES
ncbi:stage III sporulation protein AG [Bacillus mesophilus]|uniref:Stage III sporulation protein AG n=1 Tax=Bacillus mesophilus TaxID=1808955 RepID=A0A6M0Q5K0_9BACI|nr:stage III sporulation protein AG [Bacillus mesophilus]MBM7660892.1 stage III sporulation protein AG [Bacillus mesophilus]NEY71562.1 stage III sporulation protein AG [Bacillus mesophilus]